MPFYLFFGEGSPTKIEYRKTKVGTRILSSLLEDLVGHKWRHLDPRVFSGSKYPSDSKVFSTPLFQASSTILELPSSKLFGPSPPSWSCAETPFRRFQVPLRGRGHWHHPAGPQGDCGRSWPRGESLGPSLPPNWAVRDQSRLVLVSVLPLFFRKCLPAKVSGKSSE